MRSIRTKLLISFIAVIAVMVSINTFYAIEEFVFVKQYQNVTDTMFSEYQLSVNTTNMVNSFNTLIQSINDQQELATYQGYHNTINNLFITLDGVTMDADTRVVYLGLKNTINGVMAKLDDGVRAAQSGNITQESTDYDTALQQSYFVQQNTANLVLAELEDAQLLQASIGRSQLISELIGAALLFLVTVSALLYSVIFSRKIVSPIKKLSTLAKKIEDGDRDTDVDPLLLKGTDEVGSLANSFDAMVQALKKSIHDLDVEKKSVEVKVEQRTRELMEERAQLIASINSLPLGFVLLDTTGSVLLSNQKAHELFSRGDATLASFGGLFNPAIDVSALEHLMKEKQSYELQETMLAEQSFHIMAMPVVLSEPQGEDTIIGSVMLMEDITKEKRLEQSKDAFLAIAAHEMRTPLTVIRGNAELLLDEPSVSSDSGLKIQIESVLRSAVRLLDIVNDFLDVQNLEGKRVSLHVESIDIAALLLETVKDLAPLAQKKGLALTFDAAKDFGPSTFHFDKSRLQQIFTNVIGNAIHYTEKGSIVVTLKKTEKDMEILFEDTGIGISSEEQSRLFKKFETGRVFMRSKEYGSGLGLYISRFLAHLMGGDLVLKNSEVGKGSAFCLTLPLDGISAK